MQSECNFTDESVDVAWLKSYLSFHNLQKCANYYNKFQVETAFPELNCLLCMMQASNNVKRAIWEASTKKHENTAMNKTLNASE